MDRVKVVGMSCAHCKNAVESALRELGLEDVTVDLEGGEATFAPNSMVSAEAVRTAIEDAGFDAEL